MDNVVATTMGYLVEGGPTRVGRPHAARSERATQNDSNAALTQEYRPARTRLMLNPGGRCSWVVDLAEV